MRRPNKYVRNRAGKNMGPFPIGYFKGHLTQAKRLWNHLDHIKLSTQIDGSLSARMARPSPMEQEEVAEARKNGLFVKGGFVVTEQDRPHGIVSFQ